MKQPAPVPAPAAVPSVLPMSPAQSLLNRNTKQVFQRAVLPTDRQLLEKVLTEKLLYGPVPRSDIEREVSKACFDAGIAKPTQPRIHEMLVALGVRKAKRNARGVRYFNHLGQAKEMVLTRAPGDRRPAGFQRFATA